MKIKNDIPNIGSESVGKSSLPIRREKKTHSPIHKHELLSVINVVHVKPTPNNISTHS